MAIRRQQIMEAVQAALEGISVANGYRTDIGAGVKRWRPRLAEGAYVPFGADELPAILAQDRRCETTPLSMQEQAHRLTVEIEARCAGGETSDDLLRKILEDVRQAVGVDPTWGGLAVDTDPQSDEFAIVQADQTLGGVLITIVIIYHTSAWAEA